MIKLKIGLFCRHSSASVHKMEDITHCDEPVGPRPVTELRLCAHRTGWSQSVEVEVGNRCERRQVKPHPAQIQRRFSHKSLGSKLRWWCHVRKLFLPDVIHVDFILLQYTPPHRYHPLHWKQANHIIITAYKASEVHPWLQHYHVFVILLKQETFSADRVLQCDTFLKQSQHTLGVIRNFCCACTSPNWPDSHRILPVLEHFYFSKITRTKAGSRDRGTDVLPRRNKLVRVQSTAVGQQCKVNHKDTFMTTELNDMNTYKWISKNLNLVL